MPTPQTFHTPSLKPTSAKWSSTNFGNIENSILCGLMPPWSCLIIGRPLARRNIQLNKKSQFSITPFTHNHGAQLPLQMPMAIQKSRGETMVCFESELHHKAHLDGRNGLFEEAHWLFSVSSRNDDLRPTVCVLVSTKTFK